MLHTCSSKDTIKRLHADNLSIVNRLTRIEQDQVIIKEKVSGLRGEIKDDLRDEFMTEIRELRSDFKGLMWKLISMLLGLMLGVVGFFYWLSTTLIGIVSKGGGF